MSTRRRCTCLHPESRRRCELREHPASQLHAAWKRGPREEWPSPPRPDGERAYLKRLMRFLERW